MSVTSSKSVAIGLAGLVFLLGILVSFFPLEESSDDWWHLKAGQLIWEGTLGWYSPDPFTLTASEKVWLNHEWLGELLFYGIYRASGLKGAILFKACLIAGYFVLVFFSCLQELKSRGEDRKPELAFLGLLLAIPCSLFTLYLRPPIFTFFLVAALHAAILRARNRSPRYREIAIGAAVMCLWANLHGGAILGCVILGLMTVGAGIEWVIAKTVETKARLWRWVQATLIVGAASLINPYGYHLHLLTFEMMSQKWLVERISELEPPPFDLIWSLPLLLLPAILGVFRGVSWGERLVFVFLAWQGLSHVRHLPLLALWAAPYAVAGLESKWTPLRLRTWVAALALFPVWGLARSAGILPDSLLAWPSVRWLAVLALLSIAGWKGLVRTRAATGAYLIGAVAAFSFVVLYPGDRIDRFTRALSGEGWSGTNVADQIVDFILEESFEAPVLFVRDNHAGYLIWRLSPETLRTFTCNRFDLQGSRPRMEMESMLWRYDRPWLDPYSGEEVPGWSDLWDNKYRFDLVLLEKFSDAEAKRPFPLWEYLNDPQSGFANVASEEWPGQRFGDQEFTLFVRSDDAFKAKVQAGLKRKRFREPPQ